MTSQLEAGPSSAGRGKPDTDPGTGPDPPPGAKPDTAHDFKLERYKFLLQQINLLNENAHRQLTLYQSLATAVIGAGVLLFLKWREWKLDAADARIATRALLGLLGILTLFVVASIVVGVVSWLDYRREEADLSVPVRFHPFAVFACASSTPQIPSTGLTVKVCSLPSRRMTTLTSRPGWTSATAA